MPVTAFHREPIAPNAQGQQQWREIKVVTSSKTKADGTPRFTVTKETIVNGVTGERSSTLVSSPVEMKTRSTAPGGEFVYQSMRDQFGHRHTRQAVTHVTRTPVKNLRLRANRQLQDKVNARNRKQLFNWKLDAFNFDEYGNAVPNLGPSPTGGVGADRLELKAKGLYSHKVVDTYTPEKLYLKGARFNFIRRWLGLEEKFVKDTNARRIQQRISDWQATHTGWQTEYQRHILARGQRTFRLGKVNLTLVGQPLVTPFIETPKDLIPSNQPVLEVNGLFGPQRYLKRPASLGMDPAPEEARIAEKLEDQLTTMKRANNPQMHWERVKKQLEDFGPPMYSSKVDARPQILRVPGYRQRPHMVDPAKIPPGFWRNANRKWHVFRNMASTPADQDLAQLFLEEVGKRGSALLGMI